MKISETPDTLYAELFEAVQATHLFHDSKTFVDAVPKAHPGIVLSEFRARKDEPDFDLRAFVDAHFEFPADNIEAASNPTGLPVEDRIEHLWDLLTRSADAAVEHSSLIPLPNRYVVPGGRFREIYYWDSYFTMLGLADAGRIDLITDMVENFAFLIDEIGFIPNGNRNYYCTRSQPPYFALMVELLAEVSGDDDVRARFLPQMKAEYAFWMAGAEGLSRDKPANRRVVRSPGGLLNRYWDDAAIPRQESHATDIAMAADVNGDPGELYRDIRAGAESGWDYSSRWFDDVHSMQTIRTTQVIPVDLNSLLYNLEATIAGTCREIGELAEAEVFDSRASNRKALLQTLFFDDDSGMFMDLLLPGFAVTGIQSIATAYPLFFGIATEEQAHRVAECIHRDFLKAGGWVTSNYETGQQWDSPNGWAPMQWITCCGLERYSFHDEARLGAQRWVDNNIAVYREHGCLLEKYNVVSSGLAGTGGEYEVQEGFGWTNAVLVRLKHKLGC